MHGGLQEKLARGEDDVMNAFGDSVDVWGVTSIGRLGNEVWY